MRYSFSEKIKLFLSTKAATFTIITMSVAGRVILLIYFFNLRVDRSHQTIATQNFVNGHGISSTLAHYGNLSETIYQPLINWPPGYSFILSPFYYLFNQNYLLAGLAVDMLFGIILIFISRTILKLLGSPLYLTNIFTITTSFIIYSFYKKSSSDAVAITLFLTAIYFTLQLLQNTNDWRGRTALLTTSLLLCAFTKYQYMPVVFVVPSFLVLKGFVKKLKALKYAGIISAVVLIAMITALLIYQKQASGTAAYIAQPIRGLFSENILTFYPFIPAAIVNTDTVSSIINLQIESHHLVYSLLQLIHVLLAIWGTRYLLLTLYKKGLKSTTLTYDFSYIFFFISLSITALLFVLSLRVEKEDGWWTYILEPRYYGLPLLMLQIIIILYIKKILPVSGAIKKIALFIFVVLALSEPIKGMLFVSKRIIKYKSEKYSWQLELDFQKYADAVIKKEQDSSLIKNTVLAGSSNYMNNRISLFSNIPILDKIETLNNPALFNTKEPVLILIALRNDVLPDYQGFINYTDKKDKGEFGGFHFYTTFILPRQK